MSLNNLTLLVLACAMSLGGAIFFLRQPDAAISAAAQDLPSAQAAIPEVLERVYSAFALENEVAIYDALASAVAGKLIDTLYLQRRVAQVADHAEDGDATILGVEVFDITALSGVNSYSVAWRVIGRVSHISHVHERINVYAADLTMAVSDGAWKLTDFTLRENIRADAPMFVGGE